MTRQRNQAKNISDQRIRNDSDYQNNEILLPCRYGCGITSRRLSSSCMISGFRSTTTRRRGMCVWPRSNRRFRAVSGHSTGLNDSPVFGDISPRPERIRKIFSRRSGTLATETLFFPTPQHKKRKGRLHHFWKRPFLLGWVVTKNELSAFEEDSSQPNNIEPESVKLMQWK